MNPCDELAPLLAAHASGEVSPDERARVEAHLQSCEACRAEREDLAELLAAAALPAPSELEQRALQQLPGQVHSAWRAEERARSHVSRWAVGAAAAAALLAFGAGRLHRPVRPGAVAVQSQSAQPAAADASLDVDALADGPVELADESTDPYAYDPETGSDDLSLEGDL